MEIGVVCKYSSRDYPLSGVNLSVPADVMLHILNTGKKLYKRKHSDVFKDRALANEFPGVYGY